MRTGLTKREKTTAIYFDEYGSMIEVQTCCRRASLSENRRRCVSEAAEVIWRKQNRVKEWP